MRTTWAGPPRGAGSSRGGPEQAGQSSSRVASVRLMVERLFPSSSAGWVGSSPADPSARPAPWPPKPPPPPPARGEFGAVATRLPGVRVSELLPRSARLMHKLAVIRSLSHANANHVQASLAAMTGHAHAPAEEAR